LVGVGLALWLWPTNDFSDVTHDHPDLPPDHPHLREHADRGGHRHPLIVDDLHRDWTRV
ncbi:MFS transporter, partial [Pseudomonas aeruginosa]|nr:MFS transporter [Pseudomonas aeruginosa]